MRAEISTPEYTSPFAWHLWDFCKHFRGLYSEQTDY